LRQQIMATAQARESNLQKVSDFLSLPNAETAMRAAHVDPTQVKTAMATLSDQELAQLAARADKAQAQFAAGNVSDRDLLFIIAGIAVLVLIIVAVR
jgi:predicted HAD superfamily Cof-like phosphohydrolase